MTYKNAKNIVLLMMISVITVVPLGISDIFADENKNYKMAGDISPVLTFTFRNGVEVHEFPVFTMGENFVNNSGTTFSVEGVVIDAPLLHKAMDDAYYNRLVSANGYEYTTKYFEVDVDLMKNDEPITTLNYSNCRIANYQVETLDSNDYESYFKELGFAIVDKIDFECSGINSISDVELKSTNTSFIDYGESGFTFANNMRTHATFFFDGGMEKIEFPVFELISGFAESDRAVVFEFTLEGIVGNYSLLSNAVDNSRNVSGLSTSSNTDFEMLLEFTNGTEVYRGFDLRDCRVIDARIITQVDKEEGFTGKRGFALVDQYSFRCSGFTPVNMYFDTLRDKSVPIWQISHLTNVYDEPLQKSVSGLKAVTTFTHNMGTEIIDFSMFSQNQILTVTENVNNNNSDNNSGEEVFTRKATYPTFELRGIVGNYPILYKSIDENRKISNVIGTQNRELFDVDVDIIDGEKIIRGFNYTNCRVIDYDITTQTNKEEIYIKDKFALVNVFDFECQGYHPNNPVYDAMYDTHQKANTESSNDLRNTDRWAAGFTVQ